jgi:hypothetical protein
MIFIPRMSVTRNISSLIFVVVFSMSFICAAEDSVKKEPSENSGYMERLEAAAHDEGIRDAKIDFSKGIFRIQTWGMRSGRRNREQEYLMTHYHVDILSIAGCVVMPTLMSKANGYNDTMKTLLVSKFNKDIFEEANNATKNK